jgi:hypothetical protein
LENIEQEQPETDRGEYVFASWGVYRVSRSNSGFGFQRANGHSVVDG